MLVRKLLMEMDVKGARMFTWSTRLFHYVYAYIRGDYVATFRLKERTHARILNWMQRDYYIAIIRGERFLWSCDNDRAPKKHFRRSRTVNYKKSRLSRNFPTTWRRVGHRYTKVFFLGKDLMVKAGAKFFIPFACLLASRNEEEEERTKANLDFCYSYSHDTPVCQQTVNSRLKTFTTTLRFAIEPWHVRIIK